MKQFETGFLAQACFAIGTPTKLIPSVSSVTNKQHAVFYM
jgi:hypothetical protein